MFFNPNMEGMTSFIDVAFSTGGFYFVNSFVFVRVKFAYLLKTNLTLTKTKEFTK